MDRLVLVKIPEDFLQPPLMISQGFPEGHLQQSSGRLLRIFLQMSYGLQIATIHDCL